MSVNGHFLIGGWFGCGEGEVFESPSVQLAGLIEYKTKKESTKCEHNRIQRDSGQIINGDSDIISQTSQTNTSVE